MLQKIITAITLTVFIISGIILGGCKTAEASSPLAGRWDHSGVIYEFRENGVLLCGETCCKYENAGEGLVRVFSDTLGERVFVYSISENGVLKLNGVSFYPVISE